MKQISKSQPSWISRFWETAKFHWRNNARQEHQVWSFLSALLLATGCHHWISFRHNGSRFRLRASGLSRWLWRNPGVLLDGEMFFSRYLRSGDVVVDVGANIGVLTLLAARIIGKEGKVLALEAHPKTHDALVENARLNHCRNVRTLCTAVGPVVGVARFSDLSADDCNKVDAKGEISVSQQPLDVLCQEIDHIDLLKMDIEGYELPALMGAEQALKRTRCIVLECWHEHTILFGYSVREVIQFMTKRSFHGYLMREQDDQSMVVPLSHDHDSRSLENLIFVRDAAWLHERLRLGDTN